MGQTCGWFIAGVLTIQPLKSDTVRLLAETLERIPQAGEAGLKKSLQIYQKALVEIKIEYYFFCTNSLIYFVIDISSIGFCPLDIVW